MYYDFCSVWSWFMNLYWNYSRICDTLCFCSFFEASYLLLCLLWGNPVRNKKCDWTNIYHRSWYLRDRVHLLVSFVCCLSGHKGYSYLFCWKGFLPNKTSFVGVMCDNLGQNIFTQYAPLDNISLAAGTKSISLSAVCGSCIPTFIHETAGIQYVQWVCLMKMWVVNCEHKLPSITHNIRLPFINLHLNAIGKIAYLWIGFNILFMTQHEIGLGKATKLCLAFSIGYS